MAVNLGTSVLDFVNAINTGLNSKQNTLSTGRGLSIVNDTIDSTSLYFNLWQDSHSYIQNDVVIYNDILYKCIIAHTSGSTFNIAYWKTFNGSTAVWNRESFTALSDTTSLTLNLTGTCNDANNLFVLLDGKTLIPYDCITLTDSSTVVISSTATIYSGTVIDLRWCNNQNDSERADLNFSNVNVNLGFIVESAYDNSTGAYYEVLRSGVLKQYGYASTDGDILLPRSYADTFYNIQLTPVVSTNTYPICVERDTVAVDSFTVHNDGMPFYWQTVGKQAVS